MNKEEYQQTTLTEFVFDSLLPCRFSILYTVFPPWALNKPTDVKLTYFRFLF